MFKSIGLTLVGLIFLILVLIMYMTKKKYNSLRNDLFKFLLFLTLFMLIIELCYVPAIKYQDVIFNYDIVLSRIFCYSVIVWIVSFFFYVTNLNDSNNKEENKKKTFIISFIISLALCILDTLPFFKLKTSLQNGIYIISGSAISVLYIIAGITIVFLLFTLIRSKLSSEIKSPIFFIILIFLSTSVFNITVIDTNDIPFLLSFFVVGLYFTTESQDRLLRDELNDAKEKAEEINKAKTDFLSNMSHEIRTPLNTILGFSDSLLKEDNLTKEKVVSDAVNINEASINLLDLINNILDISRIESGSEDLFEKEYLLSDVLSEINSSVIPKLNRKKIVFDIVLDSKMPNKFFGDSSKIFKVLINVINNAIKYTTYGSIKLEIKYEINDNLCSISFVVSNTGHLMKEENFNIDFEDFIKLDNNNNIDSEMLGLIISKKLLNILGGTIDFANEVNKGTRYTINVVQKIVDTKEIGNLFAKEKDLNDEEIINCENKKILIVDDNDMNLKLAKKIFSDFNFSIIDLAKSGEECLNYVKEKEYDIIFIDHMMPNMDGIETLHKLKDTGLKINYVIALTANTYDGIKDIYIKEGFDDYLAKPISLKSVRKLLKKYIKEGSD